MAKKKRDPLPDFDDIELFGEDEDGETQPGDQFMVDQEEVIKKAQEGIQAGMNNAVKKGMKEGAEEHFTGLAEKVTKQILNPKDDPLSQTLDSMEKTLKIKTMASAINSLEGKPQQPQMASPGMGNATSDQMAQMNQAVALLQSMGIDPKQYIQEHGLQGLLALNNPAMLPLLLNKPQQPQQDPIVSMMLPLLMQNMQQPQPAPQPQSNDSSLATVMATMMQIMMSNQQQTQQLMMTMQEQARQSQEANQQMVLTMMAQNQQAREELLIKQFEPYLQPQPTFVQQLADLQAKIQPLQELGIMGNNEPARAKSDKELALELKKLEIANTMKLKESELEQSYRKEQMAQEQQQQLLGLIQPAINSLASNLGELVAKKKESTPQDNAIAQRIARAVRGNREPIEEDSQEPKKKSAVNLRGAL